MCHHSEYVFVLSLLSGYKNLINKHIYCINNTIFVYKTSTFCTSKLNEKALAESLKEFCDGLSTVWSGYTFGQCFWKFEPPAARMAWRPLNTVQWWTGSRFKIGLHWCPPTIKSGANCCGAALSQFHCRLIFCKYFMIILVFKIYWSENWASLTPNMLSLLWHPSKKNNKAFVYSFNLTKLYTQRTIKATWLLKSSLKSWNLLEYSTIFAHVPPILTQVLVNIFYTLYTSI